ncbi:MAG: MBL fold metallo-hydrolase [Lacibacter sp.]|jgi:glyoxylase-like metal-dependent hydrolase (beta-lactamase superfamily II)
MNRRHFLRNTAFTTAALGLPAKDLLALILQQPAWKITMLTDDIGIFTERGGTILFYAGKEGYVVVDSQFPDQSNHLIEELKKRSDKPFELLINTHHHGDHSGGNISFKGLTKHVLAHENSKANQERVAKANKTEDKQLYPDQTFGTVWSQKIGKEKITLHYFGAAHTNGDTLIHFERANIVHMGDLLFNRRHPFVDRSSGANMKSWISVLEKAEKKFDKKTKFVFGHSAEGFDVTGTLADLAAFRGYLGAVLDFTQKEINAGKTKEEFIKTTALPFETQWKGDGLVRPLTAAYEELTAK